MKRDNETQDDYKIRMEKRRKLVIRQSKNGAIKKARKSQRKARKITNRNK